MTLNAHSLTKITEENHNVILSLAYATHENFTGEPVYKKALCYLHEEAAGRLLRATDLLKPLHLSLKIWDGYRSLAAQQRLFDRMPDPTYVSHPLTGTRPHCRGVAIDLTIIDQFGNELEMGTAFDDFRALAHHGNDQISERAQQNRLLLAGVMSIAGFEPLDTEWWHYQLPDASKYPVIEDHEAPESLL